MMEAFKIDLHLHTCCSDGDTEPEILVKNLKDKGIKVFSLTDHETIAPMEKIQMLASEYDLIYIVGVELTANHHGKKHILGYGVNPECEALKRVMTHNQMLVKNGLDEASAFFSAETVIKAILLAGGVPVIAHPDCVVYQHDFKTYIQELLAIGAQGIECYHPENNEEVKTYCLELCKALDLYVTGGSDYHGMRHQTRPVDCMGITLNQVVLKTLMD